MAAKGGIANLIDALSGVITSIGVGLIAPIITAVANGAANLFTAVVSTIGSYITGVVKTTFSALPGLISAFLGSAGGAFSNIISTIGSSGFLLFIGIGLGICPLGRWRIIFN